MKRAFFFPKVLLFGEYSVILGGKALASLYQAYKGYLSLKPSEQDRESQRELKTFFLYLKRQEKLLGMGADFDWSRFQFELNEGLSFCSDIPQGYGIGSSGAVTASIFHRYISKDFMKAVSPEKLKKILGHMESHFHGKSSGLDPLVSLYNQGILVRKDQITFCDIPQGENRGEIVFFLLDTGRSRRTEALVNLFMEKLKNPVFEKNCQNDLLPMTEKCIQAFMKEDKKSLAEEFYSLSRFQFKHFREMIPPLYQKKWEEGLHERETLLKLCGAGGGGFLLGLTQNFSSLAKNWSSERIKILYRTP